MTFSLQGPNGHNWFFFFFKFFILIFKEVKEAGGWFSVSLSMLNEQSNKYLLINQRLINGAPVIRRFGTVPIGRKHGGWPELSEHLHITLRFFRASH